MRGFSLDPTMMKSVVFTVREHEEFGSIGFRLHPWMDPTDGMGCAHDILEHFPGDSGTMEEEMMAFGASLYVRGEEYFRMKGSRYGAAENLASDFPTFNGYMEQLGRTRLRYPGITRALMDENDEAIIEEMITKARSLTASELNLDAPPEWLNKNDLRGWIRKGYRKAKHRYRQVPRHDMPYIFTKVEEAFDLQIKRGIEDGQRWRAHLQIHPFRFTLIDLDEY